VKASTAGSNSGAGSSRALHGRAVAARSASADDHGSGAPSFDRFRGTSIALAATALALFAFSSVAQAAVSAKGVTGFFGTTGTAAGQLTTPRGVAVNQSTGNVYAVDGGNNRIVVFDANGKFLRAFGSDVVAYGPDQANEVQMLDVAATAGNFTLTFNGETTPSLVATATAAEVEAKLNALGTINTGGGSVTVTGGPGNATGSTPYRVAFTGGPLAATDVAQIAAVNVSLTGGSPSTATTASTATPGFTGFEVCIPSSGDACKAGTTGGTGGALNAPQGVAVNQASGDVYVTDQSNRRVQRFDQNGNFISAFGKDVVATGFPDNSTETSAVQTLTVTATEGKYTLEFAGKKTAELAYNANAGAIAGALSGLTSIGAGNVAVAETSPGVFRITFAGNLANNPEPLIVAASAAGEPLIGGTATVANTTTGASGYEICTADNGDVCKAAAAAAQGTIGGAFAATTGYPTVAPVGAPNAGDVLVADSANQRVQEFSSSGAFVRAFGWDVVKAGPDDDVTAPLNEFEVCSASAGDVCKAGITGSGNGQFGTATPTRVAEDAAGSLYTVEPLVNFRVQKFTLPVPASVAVTAPGNFDEADLKGTAASNAPTDVAVNSVNGNVLVNKAFVAGTPASCPITGTPSVAESRVVEVSSAGALETTTAHHGACVGMTPVNGLATRGSSGNLYVSSTFGASRIYVLNTGQPVAPTLLITNVSGVNAHSASINALINPGGPELPYGQETTYAIEYKRSVDSSFSKLSTNEATAGNRTTTKAISISIGGLQPNTPYDVRITANKGLGSGSVSQTVSFSTVSAAPDVVLPGYVIASGTKAILRGSINPNNQSTGYHFEYADQASFEASGFAGATHVPAVDANAGSGAAAISASQEITGLTPGATYHYRLLAGNSTGQAVAAGEFSMPNPGACPNAALRAGQASSTLPSGSTYLPNCMALEMVTPPAKYNQSSGRPLISLNSNSIFFGSLAALAETPILASTSTGYVSKRTANGWVTYSPRLPIGISVGSREACSFNIDLSRFTQWVTPPGTVGSEIGTPFMGGDGVDPLQLGPTLRPLNPLGAFAGGVGCEGGSVDASHFLFAPNGMALLPGDPVNGGTLGGAASDVYDAFLDSHGNPTIELLARDKDGKVWGGNCGTRIGWKENNPEARRGAISPDASRIYFSAWPTQSPTGNCNQTINKIRVMKRVRTPAGSVISQVSSSECTRASPACNPTDGNDSFKAASLEGDKVFFTTTRQLANSDLDTGTECNTFGGSSVGCDLYLFDASRPAGSRLTQISAGDNTDPTPGSGAEVSGLADVSGDGSHAYFVAKGVLTTTPNSLGRSAESGKQNLYLYERDTAYPGGRSVFIATLESSDSGVWNQGPGPINEATAVPLLGSDPEDPSHGGDGHIFVFATKASLTPDDTDGGRRDVYRYDSDTGSLELISTAAPGGSGNGPFDVSFRSSAEAASRGVMPQELAFGRKVSDDGRTIVFSTSEPLDPNDTDGQNTVYVWHDGSVTALKSSLPASGPPTVSVTGNEVAFVSAAKLLPEDGDAATDVYVARVNGGYPPPVPSVFCQGEACQGDPTAQPGKSSAASEASSGGNVTEPAKCTRGFVLKKGKCLKKHTRHKNAHKRHTNANRRAGK
jgi:hypothetical protein